MTTPRRIARWLLAGSLPLVGAAAFLATPARADSLGPSAIAWFDATAQAGAPAAPQPDVPAGGGLVAGANPAGVSSAGTPLSPVTSVVPSGTGVAPVTTAVTAVRFTLAEGTSASKLTLTLGGTSSDASGLTLLACQTTSPWSAGDQQPGSGPTYDCTHSSMGTADGTSLTFGDIGQLQVGNTLDVVLVPGVAGRTVIEPPTASTLETIDVGTSSTEPVFTAPYTSSTAATTSSPTAAPGHPREIASGRAATPASTAAAAAPAPVNPPPAPQNPVAEAPVALPAGPSSPTLSAAGAPAGGVAPTPVTGGYAGTVAQQPSAVAAVTRLKTHRDALLLALLLLLLLAALLFAFDPDARTGRAGAVFSAVRGHPVTPIEAPRARGVGRHSSPRSGAAPKL